MEQVVTSAVDPLCNEETFQSFQSLMERPEQTQALLQGVSPATLDRRDSKQQEFEKWFEWIPLEYRVGPWSPVAYFFLIAWPLALILYVRRMDNSYESEVPMNATAIGTTKFWIAVAGAIWTLVSNVYMVKKWSLYPYASFTLLSWFLLTLRFIAIILSPTSNFILAAAEVLRFPTILGASITTVVWNFFLQFIIYFAMPTAKQRSQFVKFNRQFSLINIHILNLPLAILSHYCCLRPLAFFDLWIGSSWLFLYALFYLTVLDARGIHMYPVFTPRTHLCFLPYSCLVGLNFAVYFAWRSLPP